MPELKKTEMCLKKDGIRISISFDKGDEEASTGIAVSPEQIPQGSTALIATNPCRLAS